MRDRADGWPRLTAALALMGGLVSTSVAANCVMSGALSCDTLSPIPLPQDEAKEIERLFTAALKGRVVIRPQAANRLIALGAAGEARILQELGEGGLGLAAMGPPIIEALGISQSKELRIALWPALLDRDFPWRPSVARALAEKPRVAETAAFQEHLGDPLAEVRAAMVRGFGQAKGALDNLRKLLLDEDDRVRRATAFALLDRGEKEALWYLLQELQREDKYFERPTGTSARISTSRALIKRGYALGNYDCRTAPNTGANAKSVAALVKSLTGEPPPMKSWQVASGPIAGERIGLELRSCRAGEFYLRWTHDDRLLVGQGNPAEVQLPKGTTQALVKSLAQGYDELEGKRFFGAAGCDLEQILLRRTAAAHSQALIIAKGPALVPDLRPTPLTRAYGVLIATLPDQESADPRLHHLLRRVQGALSVLGGQVTKVSR